MNYLIGILKILISLCFFILGFALFFVITDAFTLDYPDYAKYLISLFIMIAINNSIYTMKEGIKKMIKKDLKKNVYTFISLTLVYLSFFIILVISVFFYTKKPIIVYKQDLFVIAGLALSLLFIILYDTITLKK